MILLRSLSVGWRGFCAPSSWRVFSCAGCGNSPAQLFASQRSTMKPLKNEPAPDGLPPAPNPPKPDPPMPDPPPNQ